MEKKSRKWWFVILIVGAFVALMVIITLKSRGAFKEGGNFSPMFPMVKASTSRMVADKKKETIILWPVPGQQLVVVDPEAVAIWIYNTDSGHLVFRQEAKGQSGMMISWFASEDQAGRYRLVIVRGGALVKGSVGNQDRDLLAARESNHQLVIYYLVVGLCGSPGYRVGC